MKLLIILLSPYALIQNSFAIEGIIPQDLKPIVKFVAPIMENAENLAILDTPSKVVSECESIAIFEPLPTLDIQSSFSKKDEWSFTVMTSLTTPPNKFSKEYLNGSSGKLKSELDTLVKSNFTSHNARLSAIKQMCNGKSDLDIIQMASTLGQYLSNIYDYDRTNTSHEASKAIIKPEDQWAAMNDRLNGGRSTSGVCRDATLTISQFLVTCGFNKDQINIQSYRTSDGGHQIVNVRDKNGDLYSINWSELYKNQESALVPIHPFANNVNNGIEVATYDADGKLESRHFTELGKIMKAVAGAEIDDPNFHPHMLRLEGKFKGFNGNLFKASTSHGEEAIGFGLSHSKKINDIIVLNIGSAFAHSEQTLPISMNGRTAQLNQNIFMLDTSVHAQKEFVIQENKDGKLTIKPYGVIGNNIYFTKYEEIKGNIKESGINHNSMFYGDIGTRVTKESENKIGWVDAKVNLALDSAGSTEYTGGKYPGVAVNNTTVSAGFGMSTDKRLYSVEGRTDFSQYENKYAIGASVLDKNSFIKGSVNYSVYDRLQGKREDYVMIQTEKLFELKKNGTVSLGFNTQIPLANPQDAGVMATIKYLSP